MKQVLYIKTRPEDGLLADIIREDEQAGVKVEVFDMASGDNDYQRLLEAIFRADVVECW